MCSQASNIFISKSIHQKQMQHSKKYISEWQVFLEPFKTGSLTIGLGEMELGS